MCVCTRERESDRDREVEIQRGIERERERVCVCARVCVCVSVCVCVLGKISFVVMGMNIQRKKVFNSSFDEFLTVSSTVIFRLQEQSIFQM